MKKLQLKKLIALSVISLLTMATALPSSASAAWKQDSYGWWNTEGDSYSTGWRSINGAWYYFNTDGYMKTGWLNNNGTWYYLNDSGSMNTGWLNNNGTWYYLDPSSGAMKTGLVQVDNKTYYLNDSGAMQTGNITVNGQNYTFAASGEKVTAATSNTNAQDSTTTDTSTTTSDSSSSSSSSSSGGSGGGSSSSSSSSSTSSYSNIFGTWKINFISKSSNSTLSDFKIGLVNGTNVTISSDKLSSELGVSINNPKFSSKTLTASTFAASYKTTLEDLGIDSNSIQCVTISGTYQGANKSVPVLVADNDKLYLYYQNALFELDRA